MEIGPTREHAGSRDRGRYSCSVIFELKLEMVLGWETRSAFNRKSIWLNLQNRNSGECFAGRESRIWCHRKLPLEQVSRAKGRRRAVARGAGRPRDGSRR